MNNHPFFRADNLLKEIHVLYKKHLAVLRNSANNSLITKHNARNLYEAVDFEAKYLALRELMKVDISEDE